jgi:alpha-L-rhamnosidase
MSFQASFCDPPAAYRVAPFWFWNAKMEPEEIVRQIREMAEKGVGGFFICARQGLEVPYLSEPWFRRVAVAIEAAQNYGLDVWLYDEYPYPSGMSGGEVILQHPDARHCQLLPFSLVVDGPQTLSYNLPWGRVLLAQAVKDYETSLDGATGVASATGAINLAPTVTRLDSYIGSVPGQEVFQTTGLTKYTNKRFFTAALQKQLVWDVPAGRWRITLFLEKEIDEFKYFGTYVDPCHKEAMQTFIATTYEPYARHFRAQFGQTIKGFFTDEVGLLSRIPWSPRLPAFFHARSGYDLIESLPALLYGHEQKTAQVRYDFFQNLHLLLRETYHQQVSTWCEQHALQYIAEVPSMRMTTQLHSHVPGGDSAHEKVGRSLEWIIDTNAYNLRADPKIASSLASQLGSERAMIECFHSVGWSMTLQDAKWMVDRLAALGINFFIMHAFFSSISGLRKHDAPPSQFLQNPYWSYFRHFADYAGRLSYVMSQGNAYVPIAIVHPTTSFWTHMGNPFHTFHYCGNDAAEERALERLKQDWAYLCKQLLLNQIDYDHLDPELLAAASIQEGQLVIGQAHYKVLILPPLTNLETAAWSQIKAFLQAGGKVISVGLLPHEQIDNEQDIEEEALQCFGLAASPQQDYWQEPGRTQGDAPTHLSENNWIQGEHAAYFIPSVGTFQHTHVAESLLALLEQCVPSSIRVEPVVGERKSFLMRQRSLADGSRLIFITHQEGTEKTLRLHLPQKSIEHLDITTGKTTTLAAEQTAQGWSILLSFAPYEAHMLRINTDVRATFTTPRRTWKMHLPIQNAWDLTPHQDNILRLGTFHFMLDRENAGLQLRWQEGHAGENWPLVETRPFINQCADIAAKQAMPLQFRQSFGSPMQPSLAYPLPCWYQTTFHVEQLPPLCNLVMDEDALGGNATLYLNGHEIPAQDGIPLFEHGYRQRGYAVQHLLKQGINALVVHVEVQRDEDGVRDPLYLSGPFGVTFDAQGIPTISEAAQTGSIKSGSGIQEGYPYYAGTLSFTREISLEALPDEQAFELVPAGWDGHMHDCVEVLVNGQSLGVCCWSPYRWSGESVLLRVGSNTVEVRVTNTLSGMLEGSYFDEGTHRIVAI